MKSTFAILSTLVLMMSATATKAESLAVKDGVFQQEMSRSYHVEDGLPDNDVYSVAVLDGNVLFAGTAKGLSRFDKGRWTVVQGVPAETIRLLVPHHEGLYVATDAALYWLDNGNVRKIATDLPGPPTALAVAPDGVLLGTETGLFRERNARFEPEQDLNRLLGDEPQVRAIAVGSDGEVFVAAKAGLYRGKDGVWNRLLPSVGDASWAVHDTRGVALDRRGRLWFCSPQGVGRLNENGRWTLFDGREGLPYNDFTTAAPGEDGVVWFGTKIGAIRFDGEHWAYREGRRWLPDNEVRDVAVTAQGDAWFATPGGVGHIERRPMTLAEKARFYENEIDKYHRRTPYGYVMSAILDKPGDKTVWHNRDDDNDGQRTGEYGVAECFRYAATKDPEAKRRAKAAFEALRFLSQVTEGSTPPVPKGFPARTILPVDGPNPNEEASYSIEADEKTRDKEDALWKVIHPRWPTSADGKWYWKCDTSSDELDGHYFLYARYYDLVAETEEEKQRVREVVRAITDHLVEHDYQLVDHDGKPTRWSRFSPRELNHEPWWWEQRGLNSLSILAYLRVAEHVTGDEKYGSLADKLVRKHAYAMNTMYPKYENGPGSFVQFDDDMAFMGYYSLVRYEKDPRLREMFARSCHQYWQLEACEANSFYNFAFAAICQGKTAGSPWGTQDLSPDRQCIEKAVDTLKRYPMDLMSWRQTNSHRIDILPLSKLVRDPGEAEGKGYRTNGEVLPVDERYIEYFSDDAWQLDSGGDGRQLATGTPFLLAYYMGLYHGFIVD